MILDFQLQINLFISPCECIKLTIENYSLQETCISPWSPTERCSLEMLSSLAAAMRGFLLQYVDNQ